MKKDTTLLFSLDTYAGEEDYEDFLDAFQSLINRTKLTRFYIEGENLDWLHHSGFQFLNETKAQTVLEKIKPNTDDISVSVHNGSSDDCREGCLFKVFIYSHDCPTGSRMYFYPWKIGQELHPDGYQK